MKIQDLKTNLDWALYYQSIGWSPFPVAKGGKTPLVKWEKYQSEIATEEKIREWWKQYPDANIGIATGKVSDIVVVDVESGGGTKDLPPTVMARTGGGGFHFFYKHPGVLVKNRVRIQEKTDIRGDGGYVVATPSLHKSGRYYEWLVTPEDSGFADLPQWILKKSVRDDNVKTDWRTFLDQKNPEGTRSDQTARLAGKILHELSPELWELTGWTMLKEWNSEQNKPPLDEEELRSVWESIKKAEENLVAGGMPNTTGGRKSQSDKLIDILDQQQEKVFLFHNELKEPYVKLSIGQHKEIWSCRSKMFKRWLAKLFWETYQKSPNADALNTALNVIEGKACFSGPEFTLYNRIAWFEDALRFVNINDEDQKILFLVWIVSCFIPDFPHPIPNFYGAQGSAKSLLCKLTRKIIDPSAIEVTSFPKDINEFVQMLAHHCCIFFDNVSHLPNQISDALCKAVTGEGFSKRELYSDDDDVIYAFKRCIGINGINLVAKNPDLLERSILFELERVPPKRRRQERELLLEFENERPRIISGIFDTLTKAIHIKPSVQLGSLPRMADFTVWGCAIAEALGYAKGQFLDAYYRNIKSQNEEVLRESLVATAVCQFMETREEWEGTPSKLLKELTDIATEQGVNVAKEVEFPKAANALSRKLNVLKTNLADEGIKITRGEKDKKRIIYLHKDTENIISTDDSLKDDDLKIGEDDKNDISSNS